MVYHISRLADHIIRLPCRERRRFCNGITNEMLDADNVQFEGAISEEALIRLIRYGYTSAGVRGILSFALLSVTAEEITDAVFQKLLHFPWRKMRETFLMAIAHCPVSVYQLEAICRLQICTESYAQLIWHAAANDCFTLVDVQKIVAENRKFLSVVDYAGLAQNPRVSEEKRQFFADLAACIER